MELLILIILLVAIVLTAASFRITFVINDPNCKQEIKDAKKNLLMFKILSTLLTILSIIAFIVLIKQ